ncbi:hypothetical protein TEA_024514 [Camellia sinensis var. sinensis]|uniref:Uncharacterized protein n=1 Tax=Camellia sinensis var. sinensis TaxID=542762 RepID=A0A4S4D279_CAMSN|nr:hypothetical protein TEA_024514 [Camellia sinensis var. sinensis]
MAISHACGLGSLARKRPLQPGLLAALSACQPSLQAALAAWLALLLLKTNSTGAFLFIIREIPTSYLRFPSKSSLRKRTPLVHSSSFMLEGQILPSASHGFLCCLPIEKEFSLNHGSIFVSPPRGGSYTRALEFRALCGYTWSSTFISLPSVCCLLRAITVPTLSVELIQCWHAFAKDVFINQERKLGARRRSDTVLVSTINDGDQGSVDVTFRTPLAPHEKSKFLGSGWSMVARLKLKGIDGKALPGVEPAA